MELAYFDKFNSMKFDTKILCKYKDKNKEQIFVSIQGDVETFYTKFITRAILNLFSTEKEVKTVFMDFKEVSYISSSFIASLLHIINQAKISGIEIFFTNLSSHMEGVVDSLGMGHFVKEIDLGARGPIDVVCHNCQETIRVPKLGKFKCPSCNVILHISDRGVVN